MGFPVSHLFRPKNLLWAVGLLGGAAIAEFVLPNYVTRFVTNVGEDLGLIARYENPRHSLLPGSIESNEFGFIFTPIDALPTENAAGLLPTTGTPGMVVVEKYATQFAGFDLTPFLQENGFTLPRDHVGGLMQLLDVAGAPFGLLALQQDDCLFLTLVDLAAMTSVDRFPCLLTPDKYIHFNNSGGGYAQVDDALIIALGTGSDIGTSINSAQAQNPDSPYGKTLRYDIVRDDNTVRLLNRRIYTSGHRNPQGMHRIGDHLLAVEHGPKGGDEINILRDGANYGWPLFSAGSQYDDRDIASFAPDDSAMTNPLFTFSPSIATSDITHCPGVMAKRYAPADCMIVSGLGSLSIFIVLADLNAGRVYSVEQIETGLRIREVFVRDDTLYLLPDDAHVLKTTIQPF